MYCICCEKDNVKPLDLASENVPEEKLLWQNEKWSDGTLRTIDSQMIDSGVINIIDAPYGSVYDSCKFIIAICDSCIEQKLQSGTLLYFSSYPHNEELVESSKIKYRRRKNLDNLT
jgi:hypothetical protein